MITMINVINNNINYGIISLTIYNIQIPIFIALLVYSFIMWI